MNDKPPTRKPRRMNGRNKGDGAIAQGTRAQAAGKRGVLIGGANKGSINTGEHYGDSYSAQTIIQNAACPGASASDLRNAYLDWVSARANELPLLAAESDKPVQLCSIYTALLTESPDVEAKGSKAEHPQAALSEGRGVRRLSALEALDQSQHLVLMGGPGSGKSTFLNFVALCMAGEMLGLTHNLKLLRSPIPAERERGSDEKPKPQQWQDGPVLPVRVVLRDFAAALASWDGPIDAGTLWTFIAGQLPKPLERYADDLHAELMSSGGLILLDGRDEVPDALQRRELVKKAVHEFAALHRKCRFLVTSRTYAYQRQDWKLSGFDERELLPFTRGQIERFIDGWYTHMTELFQLSETNAAGRAELLKRATRRSELAELAERPLLLTLMARLQTRGGGTLPENREELYVQSVDTLLDEWEGLKLRRDAKGQPIVDEPSLSEYLNVKREDLRRELERLAYEAHLNQPNLVGTADIRQGEIISALMSAAKGKADTRPIRLEEYLRDRLASSRHTARGSINSRTDHSRNTSRPAIWRNSIFRTHWAVLRRAIPTGGAKRLCSLRRARGRLPRPSGSWWKRCAGMKARQPKNSEPTRRHSGARCSQARCSRKRDWPHTILLSSCGTSASAYVRATGRCISFGAQHAGLLRAGSESLSVRGHGRQRLGMDAQLVGIGFRKARPHLSLRCSRRKAGATRCVRQRPARPARRLVVLSPGQRAVCVSRRGSPRLSQPRHRFSGCVAFPSCSLTLHSGNSALRHSEIPPSGGGAGETSPAVFDPDSAHSLDRVCHTSSHAATITLMTTVEVKLDLLDQLAQAAKDADPLAPEALEKIIADALRRQHFDELLAVADRAEAAGVPSMSTEELNAEIEAYRMERRCP